MLTASLTCSRCWFASTMLQVSTLVYRCPRCEWPFSLSAPTISSPAVPATTVAAANSTGTVVAVTITGGTLTFVYVNGTQAGTTAGLYHVPVAGTISITYSVAPTWAWALPSLSASVAAEATALTFAPIGTNVAFAQNQVLIIDPSGTPEVAVVNGTPTTTSVPVDPLGAAHNSGVSVTTAQIATELSGEQAVPETVY